MIDHRTMMEEFLQSMDEYQQTIAYRGLPLLLLASGRWFQGRSNADRYISSRQWKNKRRPKAKDCYYNAQSFCLDHEEANYFEGYAMFTGLQIPEEHAWVAMPDGNVVDFTFEAAEQLGSRKGLSFSTRDTLYVGLEIPTDFIRNTLLTNEWFDSLVDEYFGI
jgi:hypothetical protein